LKTAGWEIVLQKPKPITGPVSVTISAGRPDKRLRDVDNLPKAILDLFVAHRLLTDDSQVVSITCAGVMPRPPAASRSRWRRSTELANELANPTNP
jgi:Holliday junction resolvase RusA-like endonuclease